MSEKWYWCLTHAEVEPDLAGPIHDRLGPYPSREAAAAWKDRHGGREDTWQAEDDRHKDAWDRDDDDWKG